MELENLHTVFEERIHKCATAYKLSAKIAHKALSPLHFLIPS